MEGGIGMEGWKDGRMEGWKDGRMEGWKGCLCLNRGLHGLHGLHGEERLLFARFSFNAGTSNQGINGMNAFKLCSIGMWSGTLISWKDDGED